MYRVWLKKYGSFFDEILIYFDVQFRHPFFWAFVQQSLSTIPNIKFLDPVPYEYGVGDWRNVATNELVKHATGDWLISIEQDWFTKDWSKLLNKFQEAMDSGADQVGWMSQTNAPYIHPAFWAIKKEMLDKTNKDFSAHSEINGSDHFGMITYDVKRLGGKIVTLQDLGFTCEFSKDSDMFHLGGVNQNYFNGLNEGFEFYRPEAFYKYNFECRLLPIEHDPRFLRNSQEIEDKMKKTLNIENINQWSDFFKI